MTRGRVVVAVVVLTLLGSGLVGALVRADDRPAPVPSSVSDPDHSALRTLHAWDRRRSRAYAAGSPRHLAGLYVAGSSAGTRDVRLLRGYLARGLTVTGLRMQLLAVSGVRRASDRWRLEVTDRLAGGVAVARGRRLPLPHDTACTRVLTLLRGGDGRWRVSTVSGPA